MNTTPAYLVYYNNQIDASTRTFFTDNTLLTARKAAMTYAESLFGCLIEFGEADELEIYLVEMAIENDPTPSIVARVLKRRTGEEADPKAYCREVLRELQRELAYYQTHNHPWGLGRFVLDVELAPRPHPLFRAAVLFDAVSYALVAIGADDPKKQRFDVAYDASDEPAQLLEPA